jgi:hypothetical protein
MQSNDKNLKNANFEQIIYLSNAQIAHLQSAVFSAISRQEQNKQTYLCIYNKVIALNKEEQVRLQTGELKTLKQHILKPHKSIGRPDHDFIDEFYPIIVELQNAS